MTKLLSRIEFTVAAVVLTAIVILVFVASIMRFFDHPLIWSIDLAQLLFIWLCMLGATRALRQRAHLGIDLVVRFLPRPARFWLEMALSMLVLVFFAVLVVEGTRLTTMNLQRQFGDSGLSYGWVTAAVPAGCLMLGIALVHNMLRAWHGRNKGELVYSKPEAVISGAEL